MDHTETFEAHRTYLLAIAYHMLGSVTEAEDVVQKAYLRYQQAAPAENIVSIKAYLSTIVTRLCMNHLDLARVQREEYVGAWLPEPLLTDHTENSLELHESLSLALLTLLEQLTPPERAVFLLREIFDYSYAEIAQIVAKEEAACRQMFSRAKKHLSEQRPRFKPTPEEHQQMFVQFIQAVQAGELDPLVQLLTDDVVLWADGGGKFAGALTRPLYGRELVAKFLFRSTQIVREGYTTDIISANSEPAFVVRTGSETRIVLAITLDAGRVCAIHVVGNPDKLKQFNQGANA